MRRERSSGSFRRDGRERTASIPRALSWLSLSTLSRQTRRIFRSQGELAAGQRQEGAQDDDDWVYRPQHRKGEATRPSTAKGKSGQEPVTVVKSSFPVWLSSPLLPWGPLPELGLSIPKPAGAALSNQPLKQRGFAVSFGERWTSHRPAATVPEADPRHRHAVLGPSILERGLSGGTAGDPTDPCFWKPLLPSFAFVRLA
ncbi:hypothetical protein AAFF_G00201820 [Aldrovandia affinis]|uniref:Uncharacterized protein n=1 Tax=Aldrovandia affinis TaxID=143900 RepID=A0AAD7WUP8_9TELE|nr:hypothetical protein AAFF_G00201820 [Aldrovandia affinis]